LRKGTKGGTRLISLRMKNVFGQCLDIRANGMVRVERPSPLKEVQIFAAIERTQVCFNHARLERRFQKGVPPSILRYRKHLFHQRRITAFPKGLPRNVFSNWVGVIIVLVTPVDSSNA